MDFVKREDQNLIDDENYKAYMENLQKSHQMDAIDYQHTPISMEQLHQAMQSSLNASTIVHNFQLPLSTLMLKTNHFSRNLNFNEIPAHLPRNLTSEIDLAHNLANELPQNVGRQDDALTQNLSRNIDVNLTRSLNNELELQNGLAQSLVQNLNEQDLARNLNADLSRINNDVSLPQNLGRSDAIAQDLSHEIDLSHHMNHPNIDQDMLSQDESRRSMIVQCVQDIHLIEQNLAQRLEQNLAQRLDHSLAQRLDQSLAQRLDQSLAQRLDQSLAQRLDQRLVNSSLNGQEVNQRQLEQNEHILPIPFHIKSEQEDDGYFYDNINNGISNANGLNGHIPIHGDHTQANTPNLHDSNQIYPVYNNHVSNMPALNPIDLYSRPQNYIQNYVSNNNSRDNPQNLVVHRQYDNASPYQEEFKKLRQDGGQNGAKSDSSKSEEPKENLKPTDQNKMYYTEYQNVDYGDSTEKNENDSSVHNKIVSEDLSMNIKGEYACYKCNEIFPSKRGLKQHSKICSGNGDSDSIEKLGKFSCTQCSYRCQSPAILKIHERTHTGEKPFSCTFCDYKSGQKNNVAKHILVHMKEKPFHCQYCEYRCAQKNNLVVHERTHTGYKPFACPYCDYRTVQKPNLVKHMYLHTDQKPFSCDMCSYRCVQKTNLTKHKQRHLNEKIGDKVDIKSQSKPYRPRQKSVKCPHCPYRCVQKVSLDKHLQFKHGDLEADSNFTQEEFSQGLNLMKSDVSVCSDSIQNLSVKKDGQVYADEVCRDKVAPLQTQS